MVVKACFTLWVFLVLLVTEAHSSPRVTYPGVILSNRSIPSNEASLETAIKTYRFAFIRSEHLTTGAAHLFDIRESSEPRLETGRPYLCRTAKIRRLVKQARGHINCSANAELQASVTPNDTLYKTLYQHSVMSSEAAWDITTGSDSAIVVVIDTGIDYTHPDLVDNMWRNPVERPGNGIDDDNNGYIDDIYGINAIKNTGDPMDDNGHGTHVAGIIGAVGNNARGVVGINWKVKLVAAKFLSSSGSGTTADGIKAITYATALKKAGRNIISTSNSWGGGPYSKPMLDAINAAAKAGVLFVASAGNNSRNTDFAPTYPANFQAPNIISVASIDAGSSLSSFSNYGSGTVHIAAPGSYVYSTLIARGYGFKSGTSMACPQVSGLAALTSSACPAMSMAQIKSAILANGLVVPSLQGKIATGAIANAGKTVLAAKTACSSITPLPTPTPDPRVTILPTFTPTATSTPILTKTPTSTPTATPTPTPRSFVVASPTNVKTYSTTTVQISKGATPNSTQTYLWFEIDDGWGYKTSCYRIPVLSSSVTATFKLFLPSYSTFFEQISVVIGAPNRIAATTLSLPPVDPNKPHAPWPNQQNLCMQLNAQIEAAKLN